MPTLEINGQRVKVDDSFLNLSPEQQQATVEEIAASMKQARPNSMARLSELTQGAQTATQDDVDLNVRANMEARKLMPATAGGVGAASGGISSGSMFGFDDELGGVVTAPFRAARDQVGLSEAYKREVALNRAMKRKQREANPIASTVGEIGGGLATGGTLAKGGLTMAGRNLPIIGRTGAAALEGAAYGGAYGAGNADKRNMLAEAGKGAAIGALTGGLLESAGQAVGRAATARAQKAATLSSNALKQQENALFNKARASGVMVKPQGVNRLVDNMEIAAGRINQNLRPKTAGVIEDIIDMKGKGADVQAIHELRQTIQKVMKRAESQDVRTLKRMLDIIDNFIDKPNPQFIAGGKEGLATLREAINTSARRFKTQQIERLIDLADVNTGQYTQSGMMNALRSEAKKLYKQIVSGRAKGFTREETAIIRALSKTENSSAATKLLSKFAPRGPVSMMASTITGGFIGGPVGAAIPATAGALAAKSADKAAVQAAQRLLQSASTGGQAVPVSQIPAQLRPLIGGATAGTTGLLQP